MHPIIIIGNGISGVTAARQIRKRQPKTPILLISGETDYHFSRTALMYVFMGHMNFKDIQPYEDHFWSDNKIDLLRAWVTKIDSPNNQIILQNDDKIEYSHLILAVGSTPNKFGWPGQDLIGAQGLYTKQDLDQMEERAKIAKHAVIVGGGLIGIEMAEMLVSRGIGVTFLVREHKFWGAVIPQEEAEMVERHIYEHHIDLRMGDELDTIHQGPDGGVAKITTKSGEEIPCEIVGLTAGVRPNIGWLKGTEGLDMERGIMIDHHFRTSLPNVWSIGDCAQFRDPLPGRRPLEQVWYTGKMQATYLAENLCGTEKPYAPGIWWNSAKFLDIEYQTYGIVMPTPQEGEETFYWENQELKCSVRINFRSDTRAVTGVNVFGIRHRHQVWEQWITDEKPVEEVISELAAANFDPEFFKKHEAAVIELWNKEHPQSQVQATVKKGLFSKILTKINAFD